MTGLWKKNKCAAIVRRFFNIIRTKPSTTNGISLLITIYPTASEYVKGWAIDKINRVYRRIKDIVDMYYISKVLAFNRTDVMRMLENSGRALENFHGSFTELKICGIPMKSFVLRAV